MGAIVAYDPLRLPLLRTRLLDAVAALRALSSWDAAADGALAAVARTRLLLEDEHLPAVDAALASDAMERLDFGVSLREGRRLARLRRHAAAVFAAPVGPTGLEELTDEQLVDYVISQIDDPTSWHMNDVDDVIEAARWSTELIRRLGGAGGDELAAQLVARFDTDVRDALPTFADFMSFHVEAARTDPNAGDPQLATLDPDLGTAQLGGVLLRLARADTGFEAWLLGAASESHALTRIVVTDSSYSRNGELVVSLAKSLLGDELSEQPFHPSIGATVSRVLDVVRADPDLAASLLADRGAAGALLTHDGLDADLVGGVVACGLSRPALERVGTTKPADEAAAELHRGWDVWRRAVELDAEAGGLSAGGMRGLAAALPLYLPALAGALEPHDRGSADTTEQQQLTVVVADSTVPLGTYGDVATLLGVMVQDEQAAELVGHASYSFTLALAERGIAAARPGTADVRDHRAAIGETMEPAVLFNTTIDQGVTLAERRARAAHANDESRKRLVPDLIASAVNELVFKRNPAWRIAGAVGVPGIEQLVGALVRSPRPTLSRRVALDHEAGYRAALLRAVMSTDLPTRRRIGLGSISWRRWAELHLALNRFQDAADSTSFDAANTEVRRLSDPEGSTDAEASTLAAFATTVRGAADVDVPALTQD